MGHNNVVSGHPKSKGISWVERLSTRLPDLGRHGLVLELRFAIMHGLMGISLISNRA